MTQDVVLRCIASSLGHTKIISSKPVFFCKQMQGRNAGNARIESDSILALRQGSTHRRRNATRRLASCYEPSLSGKCVQFSNTRLVMHTCKGAKMTQNRVKTTIMSFQWPYTWTSMYTSVFLLFLWIYKWQYCVLFYSAVYCFIVQFYFCSHSQWGLCFSRA